MRFFLYNHPLPIANLDALLRKGLIKATSLLVELSENPILNQLYALAPAGDIPIYLWTAFDNAAVVPLGEGLPLTIPLNLEVNSPLQLRWTLERLRTFNDLPDDIIIILNLAAFSQCVEMLEPEDELTIIWELSAPPSGDLDQFIHLVDASNQHSQGNTILFEGGFPVEALEPELREIVEAL